MYFSIYGKVHFQPRWWVILKWYENVCVCLCERESVCVCVCACVWERERKRECECVWVWMECTTLAYPHQFILYYVHAIHKHTHPQTIWGYQTDMAKSGYCHIYSQSRGGHFRSWLQVHTMTFSSANWVPCFIDFMFWIVKVLPLCTMLQGNTLTSPGLRGWQCDYCDMLLCGALYYTYQAYLPTYHGVLLMQKLRSTVLRSLLLLPFY